MTHASVRGLAYRRILEQLNSFMHAGVQLPPPALWSRLPPVVFSFYCVSLPTLMMSRSRQCTCRKGLIRKYGLFLCRRCFQQFALEIGFKKVTDEVMSHCYQLTRGFLAVRLNAPRVSLVLPLDMTNT